MVTAGMTPRDAVRQLEARLTAAGCPDADYDAAELFRLVTGQDVRLADAPLTEAQAARLESLCLRREAREPLQYLCGRWSFLDFELIVGPGVLCPRADTEVVAETAAQTLAGVKAPCVLDLCAGTGCLGLGVKRFCPDAQATCVEKSPEAFRYLEQKCAHCSARRSPGGAGRAGGPVHLLAKPAGRAAGPDRVQPAVSDGGGNAAFAAGGGAGTGHGTGSRG